MRWDDADLQQMKRIEQEATRAIMPYAPNTAPGIAAIALVRMARVLIRKCDRETQQVLTRTLVDFLDGRVSPRDAPETGLILSPN